MTDVNRRTLGWLLAVWMTLVFAGYVVAFLGTYGAKMLEVARGWMAGA